LLAALFQLLLLNQGKSTCRINITWLVEQKSRSDVISKATNETRDEDGVVNRRVVEE
jgi:hypothetical protein